MFKQRLQSVLYRRNFSSVGRRSGFTLIELLIVIAIIAILAAIALPSYTRYILRSHRAEGQALAMQIASAEERYYTNFNRYATTMGDLGFTGTQVNSENGYYAGSVQAGASGDSQSYYARVTPAGNQATDTCGYLQIDNMSNKTAPNDTGANGHCW